MTKLTTFAASVFFALSVFAGSASAQSGCDIKTDPGCRPAFITIDLDNIYLA